MPSPFSDLENADGLGEERLQSEVPIKQSWNILKRRAKTGVALKPGVVPGIG